MITYQELVQEGFVLEIFECHVSDAVDLLVVGVSASDNDGLEMVFGPAGKELVKRP